MAAGDALGRQFGGPGPASPYYKTWHDEHVSGPVRESQRAHQIAAVKDHLAKARFQSQIGDYAGAHRALRSAARERSIAARMPRM